MSSSIITAPKRRGRNKLIWIIGGLLVTGVIGFLIWCFVAGPCKSKGDKGCDPPCSGKQTCKNGECVEGDWSDAQIAKAVS